MIPIILCTNMISKVNLDIKEAHNNKNKKKKTPLKQLEFQSSMSTIIIGKK
jgi:hypothetical protein